MGFTVSKALREAVRLEVEAMRDELKSAGKRSSQQELARILGTSQTTIQKLLTHTFGGQELLQIVLSHRRLTASELLVRHGLASADELAMVSESDESPQPTPDDPRDQAIAMVASHLGRPESAIRVVADSRLKHAHHARAPLSAVEWIDLIRNWVREADLGAPPPGETARRVDPKIFK